MPTTTERLADEALRLFHQDLYQEAVETATEALQIDKNNRQLYVIRALAYHLMAEPLQGIDDLKMALEMEEDAETWYTLGMLYASAGERQESLHAHQKALALDNDHVNALINVGGYIGRAGKTKEAVACFSRAMHLSPTDPKIPNNFANILKDAGFLNDALRMYKKALELQPNMESAASNIAYLHNFIANMPAKQLHEVHRQWGRQFADIYEHAWPKHKNVKDPDRKLRIGFISEDLRLHPVGYYLFSVLRHMDQENFSYYGYYLRLERDELTEEFDSLMTIRKAIRMSDTELHKCIMADEIDILFDLSGHTSGNRLSVLAKKPAPVQMTWLGYVGSIGMKAIDYKIASHTSIPSSLDDTMVEKVMRFPYPMSHQCYTPPYQCDINPVPPSERNGYVTFGTISIPAKILNDEVVPTWAKIMRSVEGSRLLLQAAGFGSEYTQQITRDLFQRYGIDPERLEFRGFTPPPGILETYNDIDVALDPWPFSGCTTTCEVLYMGVPLVTLPGSTEASRHSMSFMAAAGLVDLIAQDKAHYSVLAEQLAYDITRRTHFRKTLRNNFLNSPVCDGKLFAEHLGNMLREAWRTYCDEETATGGDEDENRS